MKKEEILQALSRLVNHDIDVLKITELGEKTVMFGRVGFFVNYSLKDYYTGEYNDGGLSFIELFRSPDIKNSVGRPTKEDKKVAKSIKLPPNIWAWMDAQKETTGESRNVLIERGINLLMKNELDS